MNLENLDQWTTRYYWCHQALYETKMLRRIVYLVSKYESRLYDITFGLLVFGIGSTKAGIWYDSHFANEFRWYSIFSCHI